MKTATETILKLTDFSVIARPDCNPEEEYPYEVLDRDGDHVEGFDEEDDAIAEAEELQEGADQERAEERLTNLKDQAADLIADCEDEATIKKVLAMLKRASK
jgi:hypothetical protein